MGINLENRTKCFEIASEDVESCTHNIQRISALQRKVSRIRAVFRQRHASCRARSIASRGVLKAHASLGAEQAHRRGF